MKWADSESDSSASGHMNVYFWTIQPVASRSNMPQKYNYTISVPVERILNTLSV